MALLRDRYEYLGELGQGGQGRVIACLDHGDHKRSVALKAVGPEQIATLCWEFERLRHLRAPQLVEVLGLLVLQEPVPAPFALPAGAGLLVEARVQGVDAWAAAASRRDDPASLLSLAYHVAHEAGRALAVLHRAALVHRDVKPDHMLLRDDGSAVLVDLGLCAPAGALEPVAGTPAYMAPEVFAGVVHPGADVYALGASLFDVLEGQRPAAAGSRRGAGVPWQPRDPGRLPGFIPGAVRDWLGRLTSADAGQRPLDAEAFLAELEAHAESFGVPPPDALQWATGASSAPRRGSTYIPWVGSAEARAQLVQALDFGGVVQVVGPSGAGRSRLVREAVRDLQLLRARGGAHVPDYVQLTQLDAATLDGSVVHLIEPDSAQRTWAAAVCRAAEIDGSYRSVVLEVQAAMPEVPSVQLGGLPRSDVETLLRHALAAPVSEATVTAAIDATAGLAGRLCRVLKAGASAGHDMARPAAWSLQTDGDVDALALDAAQQAWLHALCLWDAPVEPLRLGSPQLSEPSAAGLARALRNRGWLRARGREVQLSPGPARSLRCSLRPVARERARDAVREAFGDAAERSPWVAEGERAVDAALERARSLRAQKQLLACQALLDEARHRMPDERLDLALAEVLRARGAYVDAREVLRNASSGEARWSWGELCRLCGEREAAREAWAALAGTPGALRGRAAASLARLALDEGNRESAAGWLRRCDAVGGDDVQARAWSLEVGARLGEGEQAKRAVEELHALALKESDVRWQGRALSLGAALRPRGDARASAEWLSAYRLARDAGEAHEAASYAVNLGLSRLDAGELGGAVEMLREGARGFAALERPQELGRVLFNWANAWLLLGEHALAEQTVERAERESTRVGDEAALASCAVLRAELSTRVGAPGDASRVLRQAMQVAPEASQPLLAARLAFVLSSLERAHEAHDVLAAHVHGSHAYRHEVMMAQARVALAQDALADAEALVLELLSGVEREGSFEERVRGLLLGAEVARSRGQSELAAARLGQCRVILDRAMRGLSTARQARMRSVEQYARAFEAVPGRSAASTTPDELRWRRLVGAVPRLFRAQELQEVARVLCEVALELVAAERALWVVEADAEPHPVRVWAPSDLSGVETHSASIVAQAWASGETVSALDATRDDRWDSAHSVRALSVRSVVAVPLRAAGERSVLYLDDRLRPAAFRDEDVTCLEELARAAEGAFYVADQRRRERHARLEAERRERWLSRRMEQVGGGSDLADERIVGHSQALRDCLRLADRVALSDLPALIRGESGTGKELVARRIHDKSPRSEAAFVAENCAALPDTLLESALFGHVRGAFTGASRDHRGLFEQAHGGTLFLDEVGEMSAGMQVKLLRVLETGEVRPVGSQRAQHVDVRLVVATHRDLAGEVRAGRFREDLFYRIAVVEIAVPALRDRPEDIEPLVRYFMRQYAPDRPLEITQAALAVLQRRTWRGNVRELENTLRRAIVLADGTIDVDHVRSTGAGAEPSTAPAGAHPLDLKSQVDALQRRLVTEALAQTGGNQTHAAELLGVSRYGLQKMLKRLSLG